MAATLIYDEVDGFRLMYSYKNDPKNGQAELTSHCGYTELTFDNDLRTTDGEYFNGQDRCTFGRMTLKKTLATWHDRILPLAIVWLYGGICVGAPSLTSRACLRTYRFVLLKRRFSTVDFTVFFLPLRLASEHSCGCRHNRVSCRADAEPDLTMARRMPGPCGRCENHGRQGGASPIMCFLEICAVGRSNPLEWRAIRNFCHVYFNNPRNCCRIARGPHGHPGG